MAMMRKLRNRSSPQLRHSPPHNRQVLGRVLSVPYNDTRKAQPPVLTRNEDPSYQTPVLVVQTHKCLVRQVHVGKHGAIPSDRSTAVRGRHPELSDDPVVEDRSEETLRAEALELSGDGRRKQRREAIVVERRAGRITHGELVGTSLEEGATSYSLIKEVTRHVERNYGGVPVNL